MSKRARWLGPSSTRRDGPEYRVFVAGRWEMITEAEAAYFERFPKAWEVQEGPFAEVEHKVILGEPAMAEAEAPDEEAVAEPVAEAEGPEVEGPEIETVLVDPPESTSPFAGSAIDDESEGGFVEVTEPEIDRDGGFV